MNTPTVTQSSMMELLHMLSPELKEAMPDGWGFALLFFNHGDHGDMLYASSAERSGMVLALRELANKLESGDAPHERFGDGKAH